MRVQSTAGFKTLVKELRNTWGHGFQRAVFDLLTQAWPSVQYAPDLTSRLDRAGIDLYMGDPPNLSLVVQCKGIQVPFERAHLEDALRSIERFRLSEYRTSEYWILFNQPLIQQDVRTSLDVALGGLVAEGKAQSARWLDLQAFVIEVFQRLLRDLLRELPTYNSNRLDLYSSAMRQSRRYIPEVPFVLTVQHVRASKGVRSPYQISYDERNGRNPLNHLLGSLRKERREATSAEPLGRSSYRVVVSEFGFGKTTLFLELASRLSSQERPAIFVAAAELPYVAFRSEHDFVAAVYGLVNPDRLPEPLTAKHVPLQVFRWALRSDNRFVLLLDGLDEHRNAYTADGLGRLFACFRDLACDVVISARSEFWETNRGNLEYAMKGMDNDRQIYSLVDWDRDAMLTYLAEFPLSPELEQFRQVIADGRYEEYYGDIPKRPLFLEMLVEDLHETQRGPITLLELYTRGLSRKLDRDISGPFRQGGELLRPIPTEVGDLFELRRKVFRMLTILAGGMSTLGQDGSRLNVTETCSEAELLRVAEQVGLNQARSVHLLMHSVITPTGQRTRSGELILRFAHRSYQEYFLAHWLAEEPNLPEPAVSLPPLVQRFLDQLREARPN